MAPKEPFKVHSLNKHVEDTKKGLSASAQYNRRPISKPAAAVVKKELDVAMFGNDNDSDESSESSDSESDSDGENNADFLKKINANGAKPAATPKRRSRDEEIADSDVERNASAKRNAATKKEQPVKKEVSSSESTSDSSSESESEESEPKAKTNGAGPKQAAAVQESSISSSEEETSEEEEEESSSEEEEAPKPIAKSPAAPAATISTPKAPAKASDSSSSSEEESSEDEEEQEEEEPAKPQISKPQASKKAAQEPSSDEEESDAEVDESMHISDREMNNQVGTPNFIAPDFALRKGDDGANGQDVARICNEANLQGKQFWYFTVPSNVPISVIENIEIPMDRSQAGNRVFSHDGQDYGISFDTIATKSSIQILIPSASDSKYQPAHKQIDQTMHIKRIANLGGAAASSVGPASRRAARPQPKGLKARYQPFGVNTPMGNIGADTLGNEDVDMVEAPAAVATPKAAKKEKKSKKEDAKKKKDDDIPTPSIPAHLKSPKSNRKGKRKHTASEDDAITAEKQLQEDIQSTETKSKKQKVVKASSPDLGAEMPSIAKKQTPIAPPSIPSSVFSSSATAVATPSKVVAATPSTVKKSTKKTKPETPAPTPRQTAVPLPTIPLTSRPKESPVPLPSSSALFTTPVQSKSKKSKKNKDEVNATGSSQQSPPPSAQGGDKKKSTIKAKGSS